MCVCGVFYLLYVYKVYFPIMNSGISPLVVETPTCALIGWFRSLAELSSLPIGSRCCQSRRFLLHGAVCY